MVSGFNDVVQERCDFAGWVGWEPDDATALSESLLERFAPRGSSLVDLCESERFRGRLILLDGVNRRNWLNCREFLVDYAQFSRNIPRVDRTAFLVLLVGAPPEEPPQCDVTLEVHEWRDVVNEMDLLFLAYERTGVRGVSDTMRMLLATTVARVAEWDLSVTERMLEVDGEDDLLDPTSMLQSVAAREGWTQDTPEDWALGTASGSGSIHAALASIARPRELRRRIWSAQAAVLLPHIDVRRYEILRKHERKLIKHLAGSYGNQDPYSLEIGDLADTMRQLNVDARLRHRAERLRSARNDLAHLRPLSCERLRALMRN